MSKVYKLVITAADRYVPSKLRPLWEHEAGPKTIFFWAPAFKWLKLESPPSSYSTLPKTDQELLVTAMVLFLGLYIIGKKNIR